MIEIKKNIIKIQIEKHENHKNLRISYENHENLEISLENHENHENHKIHIITCQNLENHTKLNYSISEP